MDKIVRFLDLYYPIEACNFECDYCYVHVHRDKRSAASNILTHSATDIRNALSFENVGGKCWINICAGGETLLYDDIWEIVNELLKEGHYISVVTNGTVKKSIRKVEDIPLELREHLMFKFSLHYLELKKRNMLETFANNVHFVKDLGCSFTIELPAYDGYVPLREEIKSYCRANFYGQLCHVTALRDESKSGFELLSKLDEWEYEEIWGEFQSPLFSFRNDVIKNKYRGFCYAGEWTFTIHLGSGDVRQCYSERLIGNLYDGVPLIEKTAAVGNCCHQAYCSACHAFLLLGDIPEMNISLRYDEIRDRNGKWLTPAMKDFFHQRLADNHALFTEEQKRLINTNNRNAELECAKAPYEFLRDLLLQLREESKAVPYVIVEARNTVKRLYPQEEFLAWVIEDIPEERVEKGDKIALKAGFNKDPRAEGNEVWIDGIIVDNHWNAAEIIFDKTWINKNRMVGWNDYSEVSSNEIWGIVPEGKKRTLILSANRWGGIIEIRWNNQTTQVRTYKNVDNGILILPM